WIWGEFVQRGTIRRGLAVAVCLALVAGAGALASNRSEELQWQPWSRAAVEEARAKGRPGLVDFTADWGLTCQVNLRTSIDTQTTREMLAKDRAVTLIADFTRYDQEIAKELHHFGRDAVPLVVVYPKQPEAEPIVLPPVLTPQIVHEALDKAGQ